MKTLNPEQKTILTTVLFSLAGVLGASFAGAHSAVALPLILFYCVITLNTYYSLKLFTHLVQKQSVIQHAIDILLVVLYILLACSFDAPLRFTLIVALLFTTATLKYVLLLGTFEHPQLLKRKIIIDIMGVFMGISAFAFTTLGYPVIGSWYACILFGTANIYVLILSPMYRI